MDLEIGKTYRLKDKGAWKRVVYLGVRTVDSHSTPRAYELRPRYAFELATTGREILVTSLKAVVADYSTRLDHTY